jgi:hypothetical protein
MTPRSLVASLLALALPAHAATLAVTPANPTPADTIVVEMVDAPACSSIAPNAIEMTDGRVIRVHYNDGTNIRCLVATGPVKAPVGALPAGTYRIEFVPNLGAAQGAGAATNVTVTNPTGQPDDPPFDNFSGQYATGRYGEGVVVVQSGKIAFVTFLYLRADGASSWAVMPDARWGPDEGGGMRFFGEIWALLPSGTAPRTGQLTAKLGYGSFYPSGVFDQARIETHIPEMQSRTLTRHRF